MLVSDAVPIGTSWDKGKKLLKLENKKEEEEGGHRGDSLGPDRACSIWLHSVYAYTQTRLTQR